MAMTLRVVVPPHPLIGHWLSVLRDRNTPPAVYASATCELGRWLTYEALRDWLPHRSIALQTAWGDAEGQIVDPKVPLHALTIFPTGLGLWQGAQGVLPQAQVAHIANMEVDLPKEIDPRAGVLVFAAELAIGEQLLDLLNRLAGLGVEGDRLRVVTALCSSPGLKSLGERFSNLTIYTACIDAALDGEGRITPGIGPVHGQLFNSPGPARPSMGC
ncbi:uracil phosphoribosyltransferase [Cyanobium sp. HWJ4-Hawea]|uniref:uracil phosphoribosyltransferase n=1 Tax=Cyanobium sp. HWJ4-Hawea TaxID=2823713 RepID=UPI0020CBF2D0|nr:uracil phosphoribosyltransferase [Cyanobium sp. HWJ4-Hawea]MCP9809098.1 uracil phosphoribosyltransferase [Cyanobium sp. HWJ4-Hawea]